ncbi:unnamed protein product [Owenia fusiformis]|uniref:Sodium-coupled monocarboxylate transporter 1 n=1 Tax=Owenia fusiformis TaxID=6347 RepID=A0A8S4PUW6_OWEFU|nr:unnamed protein product [Owenia fusiformis]
MKAVLWADSLQLCLILCGSLALVIQGSINLGGIDKVFNIATDHGRIEFDELDPNPTTRHSVWGLTIGMVFFLAASFSTNQHSVQRYLTLGTKIRGQGVLYLNIILSAIFGSINIMVGIVMFATYASCDPIKLGKVEKVDQMPAYLVVDLFGHLRGMSGLFIVTVIAAAMSTMSSGQNALAAVFLEDVTKPIYKAIHKKPISERFATNITKCFGIFFGLATIAVTFLLTETQETVLNIAWKLLGILGGPIFAMFTFGILFPCANSWGVATGLIASLGVLIWINAGVLMFKIRLENLPTDISGCGNISNFTTTSVDPFNTTSTGSFNTSPLGPVITTSYSSVGDTKQDDEPDIFNWYKVSYVWYTLIALIVMLIVGLPVSLIANCAKGGYEVKDERLLWTGCRSWKKMSFSKPMNEVSSLKNDIIRSRDGQASHTHGMNNAGFNDSTRL